MESKLITTQDYLLLVDTEGPEKDGKPDDTVYERETGKVVKFKDRRKSSFIDFVIAHLPLNNAPVLEGVPLLPELPKQEEEIENLKWEKIKNISPEFKGAFLLGFENGYEVVSKKWSEEDIRKAIRKAIASPKFGKYEDKIMEELQSLSPSTLPVDFIPEYAQSVRGEGGKIREIIKSEEFKIVNGIVQGKYVYA